MVIITAPQITKNLVERFSAQIDDYKQPTYNETQLRREFVDPLFEALGWDVANKEGYAEAYKEVVHEDRVRLGSGHLKAPDYSFRIGGVRKFFLETKKPSVNIRGDQTSAFQLRRYAWSAKLPLSILTNFECLAVYDTRVRPDQGDKAPKARVLLIPYTEYEKRWHELVEVFSKQAILKGSFDRYVASQKLKKGTAEVDNAFLEEIERWRTELARIIALRNPSLNQRELNFAVQRTIDRIVFLRICEDRGIERYGQLQGLLNGGKVYERLFNLFRKADNRFNSGLFHFRQETGRTDHVDEITHGLAIDDKSLKDILKNLYYPDSPYEFSVLPADILGQVYERFLGKVIRLTAGHQAKIEDKPEVRKAGGVYYTPTYVVEYIVKQTIGRKLEGLKPSHRGPWLKVLDPACGSGSFLLCAYQYLLDWHLASYMEDPRRWTKGSSPRLYQVKEGQWKLTIWERKRILLEHIFGVDIDQQAVEVTKLSLLLKVLEGEDEQSLGAQLGTKRALPDLGANIKCGNSLIGPDYWQGKQMFLINDEERYKVNPFDWDLEFIEIMKKGGFDVVIGNPPYIPIELMSKEEKNYYQSKFGQLERKYDSSVIFIPGLLRRLNDKGLLSFISSLTWQTGENYAKLREYIFKDAGLISLVNLPFDVFKEAYVDTGVYVISKHNNPAYLIYRFNKKAKSIDMDQIPWISVNTKLIAPPGYKVVLDPISRAIVSRSEANIGFIKLGDITTSTQGLAGNKYEEDKTIAPRTGYFPYFEKGQVYRYFIDLDRVAYVSMLGKETLIPYYNSAPKILVRRVVNRQNRLMATYFEDKMVFKKDINPF